MNLTFPRAARAFFNWFIWIFLSFCRDTSVKCIWSALIFLSLSTSVAYILKFYSFSFLSSKLGLKFLIRTSTAILSSFISVFFISNKAFPSSRSLCRNSLSKRSIRALNWSFFVLNINMNHLKLFHIEDVYPSKPFWSSSSQNFFHLCLSLFQVWFKSIISSFLLDNNFFLRWNFFSCYLKLIIKWFCWR